MHDTKKETTDTFSLLEGFRDMRLKRLVGEKHQSSSQICDLSQLWIQLLISKEIIFKVINTSVNNWMERHLFNLR